MEVFFAISIPVLGLIATVIALLKDYRDKRYTKRWWKQLKPHGVILSIIAASLVGLSFWNFSYTRDSNQKAKAADDLTKRTNDSLMRTIISARVDSNRKVLFNDLQEALGKQGLYLDSVGQRLVKANNSRLPILPKEPTPTLFIGSEDIWIDGWDAPKKNIHIKMTAMEAAASNFHIECIAYLKLENREEKFKYTLFDSERVMPLQTYKIATQALYSNRRLQYAYLDIRGYYSSLDGKKTKYIDELFRCYPNDSLNYFLEGNDKKIKRRFIEGVSWSFPSSQSIR